MSVVFTFCHLVDSFLVQFACSFSRIARYSPSLTNKLTQKIVSLSVKANLQNRPYRKKRPPEVDVLENIHNFVKP